MIQKTKIIGIMLLAAVGCSQPARLETIGERAREALAVSATEHARNRDALVLDSFVTVYESADACVLDFTASSSDSTGLPVSERMEYVYYEASHGAVSAMYRQAERDRVVVGFYSNNKAWEYAELQPVFEQAGWIY